MNNSRLDTQKAIPSSASSVAEYTAIPPQNRVFDRSDSADTIRPVGLAQVKLLLVSPDKARSAEFERGLLRVQPCWTCRSSESEPEALAHVASLFFDVVILDSLAGNMAAFVEKLAAAAPRTLRFVLGEASQSSSLAQHVRAGTEFLSPHSETSGWAEAVARSLTLQGWMTGPSMRKLLASIHKLPTLPKVHMQIIEKLRDPESGLEEVSQLVKQDPVMAAKFLQIVNSACFALAYTVTDASEAVMFLGAERTRTLVLMANIFSQFDGLRCPGFSLEDTWSHSTRVASLSRGVALLETEDPNMAEMAFTAGLLHEIGNLILAGNAPEMFATVRRFQAGKQLSIAEAELEMLGTTTALLGACLLGTWRLPLPILEAIAWHGCPAESGDSQFSILTAVHAANVLAQETVRDSGIIDQPERFDLRYLARLGISERRNQWREACGLPIGVEQESPLERIRRQRDAKNN